MKRVHAPVLPLGFDNICVSEQQKRLPRARSVIAGDKVGLFRDSPADEEVGIRKAGCLQAFGHGFGGGGSGARAETGFDFDQLFVDITRQLLIGRWRHGISTERRNYEQRNKGECTHDGYCSIFDTDSGLGDSAGASWPCRSIRSDIVLVCLMRML